MSGAGNLFAVGAAEDVGEQIDRVGMAREVCGADGPFGRLDGLILVDRSEEPDRFVMEFYNPDGSSGMMCGNGARCAVRFAVERGYVEEGRDLRFANFGTEYAGRLDGDVIRISFPDPIAIRLDLMLDVDDRPTRLHFVDVGTPHLIRFLDETDGPLDDLDIDRSGPLLRRHEFVLPSGANANFASVDVTQNRIDLRTFERGVEAETGACGTGAIATALAASRLFDLPSPVTISPTSNQDLFVSFTRLPDGRFTDVVLGGPGEIVESGKWQVQSVK